MGGSGTEDENVFQAREIVENLWSGGLRTYLSVYKKELATGCKNCKHTNALLTGFSTCVWYKFFFSILKEKEQRIGTSIYHLFNA